MKKEVKKEFIRLNLSDIKPYENNPRINDDAVADVMESIKQCHDLDPIEIDENNVILSGHTRLKALIELGYTEADCLRYTGLTDAQKRKYRLLANKVAEKAKWDFELLPTELEGLDFEGYDFDFDLPDIIENEPTEKAGNLSLVDKFVVPPFSILDTRQGYWQERKDKWKQIGIKSELGRKENLISVGLANLTNKYLNGSAALQGGSIFDPVLCEIMYKWFCPKNGKIFDPFGGGERARCSCGLFGI